MIKKNKYLVCPLNWGLGHASRMIPIVDRLINDGHEVILGGDGDALALLKQAFPQLESIYIADIHVTFSQPRMLFNLLLLIPKIIRNTIKEHISLKKIIKKNSINVVISDNRYGLWNKNIKSILVTHQLMIKIPAPFQFMEYAAYLMIKRVIGFFDRCWVPDYEDPEKSLSGDLSRKYPVHPKVKFIGPLSRYNCINERIMPDYFQVVVILSGPEPLRSKLENQLTSILCKTKLSCLLIQGKPQKDSKYNKKGNITFTSHLPTPEIKYYLKKADYIICRSGYSSIMDLDQLQLNAILIPTPGQTEQEYLANYLQNHFQIIKQNHITNLNEIQLFTHNN